MQDPPQDWPRVSPSVFYDDAAAALAWLVEAFGFELRLKVEGPAGEIMHSELTFGGGLVMVGAVARREGRKSPRAIGGANTQSIMIFVDDADAHAAHARAHGAKILAEPHTEDYGEEWWSDRSYEAEDLEGHRWWFTQRIRSPKVPPPKTAKHA